MIVVDASVLVAIIKGEPEAVEYADVMRRQDTVVSAATVFEASMVLEARRGPDAIQDLKRLLAACATTIAAIDEDLAWRAHEAWRRFGKGRHPAGLNFGDCFSYALAASLRVPLLFKGDDFSRTDVTPAR